MRNGSRTSAARRFLHTVLAAAGAAVLTLAFFLVLPVIQTINEALKEDELVVTEIETATPPPPEAPEPEREKPEEPPKEQPKLKSAPRAMPLAQIENLLAGTGTGGGFARDFVRDINPGEFAPDDLGEMIEMSDLDQPPRVIYQPSPRTPPELRGRGGKVHIVFDVNEQGRVENARVEQATHPLYKRPAQEAVKRWKFEPGKRAGKPVRFRMRVPIRFPKK